MADKIDELAKVALWYKNLVESNNRSFMPLFWDERRFLVLKGGGGSGKSIFAGRKILERVTSERDHRWLVCRKVAKTLRESCFAQLVGQISAHYPDCGYKVNKSEMIISFANGSKIMFAGLDDVEKLKSIFNVTGIWIEEASELLESDFDQLDIRLRGETKHYKQIIVSFNPISIMHWLKKRFFDEKDGRATVHESTYKDNRFLDEDAIRTLEEFRDRNEYFYSVYCLGEWGVTGRSVFDAKAITRRLAMGIIPYAVGRFEFEDDGRALTQVRWVDDPDGFIKIYAPMEAGVPYVIGGDTAGEGSDRFTAQAIDNRTGRQVATLLHQFDEDVYARQVYCLGLYYNTALVSVEVNYSTYPVKELERLRYPKLYVRETVDDFTHRPKKSYGFRTDARTRPLILAQLVKVMRDDVTLVSDRATMEEMLTFVRNEAYRPEAEAGAHDDCIMGLAIAHYARTQQRVTVEAVGRVVKWSQSQWEDYRNASPADKAYLISKWGDPR